MLLAFAAVLLSEVLEVGDGNDDQDNRQCDEAVLLSLRHRAEAGGSDAEDDDRGKCDPTLGAAEQGAQDGVRSAEDVLDRPASNDRADAQEKPSANDELLVRIVLGAEEGHEIVEVVVGALAPENPLRGEEAGKQRADHPLVALLRGRGLGHGLEALVAVLLETVRLADGMFGHEVSFEVLGEAASDHGDENAAEDRVFDKEIPHLRLPWAS